MAKTLPPLVQTILNKVGSVDELDVIYDDDSDIKYMDNRAAKLGVKCARNLDSDVQTETISGKIESVLKYLRDYNESDYGYQCGAAINIPLDGEDDIAAFNAFVKWMNASYEDFAKGVEINAKMHKYLINA